MKKRIGSKLYDTDSSELVTCEDSISSEKGRLPILEFMKKIAEQI